MKLIRELSIVLAISFAGELLHRFFISAIPGSVIGMLLLFGALCMGILDVKEIETTSEFLLKHLAFFFVPAAVGLITCLGIISSNLIGILGVLVISSVVVIITTGFTVQILKRMMKNG
ncbi:CidA/LrgA family protein [Fonticella tunisiensis]|uniref:Holin-like protein n=1 Tax=Fonticella tunisiensis TaxID=1096341 RepID=A0A4R7KTK5_9CLOT|nr:CidA/LrgA family protein [Fonticella tunisiensis]TDT63349.1 holin-like protein [Fonticella tunisiensis]